MVLCRAAQYAVGRHRNRQGAAAYPRGSCCLLPSAARTSEAEEWALPARRRRRAAAEISLAIRRRELGREAPDSILEQFDCRDLAVLSVPFDTSRVLLPIRTEKSGAQPAVIFAGADDRQVSTYFIAAVSDDLCDRGVDVVRHHLEFVAGSRLNECRPPACAVDRCLY